MRFAIDKQARMLDGRKIAEQKANCWNENSLSSLNIKWL